MPDLLNRKVLVADENDDQEEEDELQISSNELHPLVDHETFTATVMDIQEEHRSLRNEMQELKMDLERVEKMQEELQREIEELRLMVNELKTAKTKMGWFKWFFMCWK